MNKPEFDLSKVRSIKGASITEYRMYSDKVARVIATFVGSLTPEDATDRITAVLNGAASPIRSSFRWLEKGRSALGFVSLVNQVRAYDEKAVTARYHRINANLFMDSSDESIWEVKPGSGGSYLAKKGNDNLAELIEAARISPRGSMPRMTSILSAAARPTQFVAYVEPEATMVDYGFCVEAKTDGSYSVLSNTTSQLVNVARDGVIGVYTIEVPQPIHAALTGNKPGSVRAGFADAAAMIEYYKKAYAYAPDYVESIIRQIEQQAAL